MIIFSFHFGVLPVVNSPERFRKQIIDVGQSLQAEQKDAKAAERKVYHCPSISFTLNQYEI